MKTFGRLAISLMIATGVAHQAFGERPGSELRVPRYIVTNAGPASKVLVWNSLAAHERGAKLVLNGVSETHPELIWPLVACIVPNGTRVMLDDAGILSHDITVIDGAYTGCQGNIASNDLKRVSP